MSNNNKKIKDTHRKKALSNKTTRLTKSMNMDIWVVSTSDKKKVVTWITCKTPFFALGPFSTLHSINQN